MRAPVKLSIITGTAVAVALAGGCAGSTATTGDRDTTASKVRSPDAPIDRVRPTAVGTDKITVPFGYDTDAVEDLGDLAVTSGGTLYLSPSPEDVTAVLRSAVHNAVAYAGGRPSDIVLAVDTTGSMGTAVRAAALAIEWVGKDIEAHDAPVRLGLLEYKDTGDEYVVKTVSKLTKRLDRIKGRLASLEASGGGDWPEAVPAVIMEALEMDWDGDAAKTIILIADAPSHPDDPLRRGLGHRAHDHGVAVDVIVVGTNAYAGGYDDSMVDDMEPYEGDDDDDDGYTPPPAAGTETMEDLTSALGGELHEAKDDSTYRSVVTRILTDLRYGSSKLAASGGEVDLVFVVDTTGSMGSACAALNDMGGPIAAFLKSGGRIGIVNYKDTGDDFVSRIDLRLTSDRDDVMATLRKLSASGGGDLPEAAWEALAEVTKMPFRKRAARVVVLITDADAHSREPFRGDVRRWFKDTGAGLAVILTGYF